MINITCPHFFPCQEGTPEFIGRCVASLGELGLNGRCLLRLDSGNDAEENFQHFGDSYFIVKRNLRRECPEQWLATARNPRNFAVLDTGSRENGQNRPDRQGGLVGRIQKKFEKSRFFSCTIQVTDSGKLLIFRLLRARGRIWSRKS